MKKFLVLLAALAAGSAQAWDCKFAKDIDVSLDLAGSEQLRVAAAAGDLEIVGHAGTTEARVRGKVCASEEEWLEQAELITAGFGQRLELDRQPVRLHGPRDRRALRPRAGDP